MEELMAPEITSRTLSEEKSSDEEEKMSLRPRRKSVRVNYAEDLHENKRKGKPEMMNLRLKWPSHIKYPDGSSSKEWFEDQYFFVNLPVIIQENVVLEDSAILEDAFKALHRAEDERPNQFEGFDRDAFRFIGTVLSSTSESF
jgi:hypothetical protein